jgi:chloramphenicol-sensitive protein RarD
MNEQSNPGTAAIPAPVPSPVSAPVSTDAGTPQDGRAPTHGFLCALSAYLIWGVLPLYMKAVAHISPAEVVFHRVIWSVPVAAVLLVALGRTADVKAALRSPRTLAMAALTAAIISLNWGIYIWAIAVGRTVEGALGYYINPLVTVLLGWALLGERLDRIQWVAVGLAAIAVALLTVEVGGLPWISLALAVTFAAYGFLRKTLPIGPSQGFFLEVLLLLLPCIFGFVWLEMAGQGHFISTGSVNTLLLLAAGPLTAVPLILYGFGAKLLRFSTIGLMQYIAPTMVVLIAVFVFDEPFGTSHLFAFGLIWLALALYTWSILFRRP